MNTSVILCLVYGSRSFHCLLPAGYAQRVLGKLAVALDTVIDVEEEQATVKLTHHNVFEAYDVMVQMQPQAARWLEDVSLVVRSRKVA